MRIPVLYNLPPLFTLALIFVFSIIGGIVFALFFAQIGQMLFGFNAFTGSTDVYFNNPDSGVVNSLRLTILGQHIGMFILPGITLASLFSFSPTNFLHSRRFNPSWWAWLLVISALSFPAIDFMVQINEWILPESFSSSFLSDEDLLRKQQTTLLLTSESPLSLLFTVFLIAIIPAVGEELFFRGLVMGLFFRSSRSTHLSIWVTAILFSLIHFELSAFIPRMMVGALLGYVLVLTGSILASILLHFLNNLIPVLTNYFFTDTPTDEIEITPIWFGFLGSVILLLALVFLFKKKNWKKANTAYGLHTIQ